MMKLTNEWLLWASFFFSESKAWNQRLEQNEWLFWFFLENQ